MITLTTQVPSHLNHSFEAVAKRMSIPKEKLLRKAVEYIVESENIGYDYSDNELVKLAMHDSAMLLNKAH